MAKTKNKKKSVADSVRGKKKGLLDKVNPFEVRINRQKHKIVGQKRTKHEVGRPGVSRSRAIQKRKDTLLVEYKKRGKVNVFVDRRLGENDPEMSVEDKMLQRYAAERQRSHGKSIFNLNEDEELTHYGQSLSQIEKFDEPVISDDDNDDEGDVDSRGNIGAKMVAEQFFGGGVLSKKDGDETDDDGKHKTWKERMEEIIAKSKKQKYERQHEKEQVVQLTEQVDAEWKEMRLQMASSFKKRDDVTEEKKADDYDRMVRELHFEVKGTPADRLKSDEEIAKDEKQKLDKLEADRIRRMKGLTEEEDAQKKKGYRSADSLDDGFGLETTERFEAVYKDGKLVTGDDTTSDQSEDEEESHDEKEDGESENEDESDDDSNEEDSDDEDDDDDDVMKHLSDLESDGEADETEDRQDDTSHKTQSRDATSAAVKRRHTEKDRKQAMAEAREELPYVFSAPETYEELRSLLSNYSEMEQLICIERVRKCTHPSLAEGNKARLELLFTLLTQYYGDLALQRPPLFWLMDKLVPHLYELSTMSPEAGAQSVLDTIMHRQALYCEACQRRNGRGLYPQLDVLLYFKLVSVLYPTSDLYHPVVTPTMLFMSQIITQSCVNTNRDVASGLLLCSIFLEYVSFSKRFVPEVINFLNGVLFLTYETDSKTIEPVIPPFKPVGKHTDLLVLKQPQTDATLSEKLRLVDIYTPSKALKYLASDQFRLDAVNLAVKLLQQYCDLYEKLPAYDEIFKHTVYFCEKLPLNSYPQPLKDAVMCLKESILKRRGTVRKYLQVQKQKTKALKLYEPKVEEDFDPTRKKKTAPGTSKAKEEKQRLVAQHKKEMKGAIREIRRDTQFLAKERLDEQINRDNERKRKVKELLGQLADQQGDLNALKRLKDKS